MKTRINLNLFLVFCSVTLIFPSCGKRGDSKKQESQQNSVIEQKTVEPISLATASTFAKNYQTMTEPFNIPYNWYLETDTAKNLLRDFDGKQILGIRFYGCLHSKDINEILHLIVVPVADLGGPNGHDDITDESKIFQYTRTCPNLCGVMDVSQQYLPSTGISFPKSWFISKADIEKCYTNPSGTEPKFIKIKRSIEGGQLRLHFVGVSDTNNHTEMTNTFMGVDVAYPALGTKENPLSNPE